MIEDKALTILLDKNQWVVIASQSAPALKIASTNAALLQLVNDTTQSANLADIIALEKTILEDTLEKYGNSQGMQSSYETGIRELGIVQNYLEKVADSTVYQGIDNAHENPKNRDADDLPMDEARKAIKGHLVRLSNLDKAPLDDGEKQLISARQTAFRTADKLYKEKQQNILKQNRSTSFTS